MADAKGKHNGNTQDKNMAHDKKRAADQGMTIKAAAGLVSIQGQDNDIYPLACSELDEQ